MRVPYEWLRELVEISAAPDEVSEKLTMIGLEVEGTESVQNEIVFEVNVTPNRPDCLNIIGIARELAAAFQTHLKMPPHGIEEKQPQSAYSVEIVDEELCNRYAGRVITGVTIADSPPWIKKRLEQCGIRSINNVVDITNYMLLEFGHPLHAFDADTLKGRKVVVGTPETVGGKNLRLKFKTLDGAEREIPEDSLLIWDAETPVAVAGVMGGADTEVTGTTRNIFLESAYFAPVSIRKTSKKLGLASESSYRFERGTDIEFLEKALDRAALLMRDTAGGTIHQIIDVYPVKYVPEPVEVHYEKINKLLGTTIADTAIDAILQRLGIPLSKSGDAVTVSPPAYRRDIRNNWDVAEEIARIFGYNNIPTTVPKTPLSSGRLDLKAIKLKKIREAMRKSGFNEVINFSFMGGASLDLLSIQDNDRRRKQVVISNPLSQDSCLLRTTLLTALIANMQYNLDRGMKHIRFFEIARVFEEKTAALPAEELRLGGILFAEKTPSLWKEEAQGFYLMKGALESLLEELRLSGYSFTPSAEPFLHPGQSADISVKDSSIGHIGVLAPAIVEKLDLKKMKPEIVVFELNLDFLLSHTPDTIQYRPIPKFPPVERDIALVVDEKIPAARVEEIMRSFPSELIAGISFFDFFKGKNIPAGKKSLAFNILYRSNERTLRDEEIETLHASLVDYLIKETGGELRK
jgi:phenylalanyl-tRNA synthetase beta chain